MQPSWLQYDLDHIWHPYTQMHLAPEPLPIVRAEGIYLYTSTGRKIIDAISSWWVCLHGHNHPRLNAAFIQQVQTLSQVIFAGFTHEPAALLAQALCKIATPNLKHVFYSDNGSTAIEVAMKMALQYWQHQNEKNRTIFIAFDHAYHGDTFGAMAAGQGSIFNQHFEALLLRVMRASLSMHQNDPRSLEALLSEHHANIAAVILEPMLQGAGGMLVQSPAFLSYVRKITDTYGIPLIADEVFTGFGRTGKMFACEHAGIEPDFLCLSKSLTAGYMPLGATLTTASIYQAFLSTDRNKTFFHGHSYTGNALACAVALESLNMIQDTNMLEKVFQLETWYKIKLESLRTLPQVQNIRILGSMAAIELVSQHQGGYLDNMGPTLAAEFLKRDILIRPLGNVIYLVPPMCIQEHHIDFIVQHLQEVIAQLDTLCSVSRHASQDIATDIL